MLREVFHANGILSRLYSPNKSYEGENFCFIDTQKFVTKKISGELAIPPPNLRENYATESDELFLSDGSKTYRSLRSIMSDYKITIDENSSVMDWGYATGRVLRHFAQEAKRGEFWGVDQSERYIMWAKDNLSPPFRFLTCTSYPHLPFSDNKFSFIYGMSIFTHIIHLQDLWLMEFNRVLTKGGYAVFSIHDENTDNFFLKTGKPEWIPDDLTLEEILKHDVTVIPGRDYKDTFAFFKDDWIKKEWGRYFKVVEIRPYAEDYQSAVVLMKNSYSKE
jgi:ubiquinone/menaquinone biosynthesis C-methylase UbiE